MAPGHSGLFDVPNLDGTTFEYQLDVDSITPLIARYIGMAPTRLTIARQADEDRLVADMHMGLAAVPLEPVTVTARRNPRGNERPTPGSTERDLSPQLLARLPIDASDLNLVATLAPGVVGIVGTDSTDAG